MPPSCRPQRTGARARRPATAATSAGSCPASCPTTSTRRSSTPGSGRRRILCPSRATGPTCSGSSPRRRGRPPRTRSRSSRTAASPTGTRSRRPTRRSTTTSGRPRSAASRTVLDALVAEARERWGLNLALGLQVVAAERLIATPIEASRPLLVVPLATLDGSASDVAVSGEAAALPGRHGPRGRDPLALLRRLYPADAAVGRLDAGGASTSIGALEPDDLLGPLYLPPIEPEAAVAGPWAMPFISNRLRQPDGCPWDREQTHASLRKHLLEEAYEVYDALERGATSALAEELGDLLL